MTADAEGDRRLPIDEGWPPYQRCQTSKGFGRAGRRWDLFWHIVKFRFLAHVDDQRRRHCEDAVRALPTQIAAIKFVRSARSVDEPDVTGLVMGFHDQGGYEPYQVHPAHVPVAAQIDSVCHEVVRVDFITDDNAETFA